MAAVNVRPARTGDMGILDKFDCPEMNKKERNSVIKKNVCESEWNGKPMITGLDLYHWLLSFS